jgi:NADH-quinone oxidoreductase subunit N
MPPVEPFPLLAPLLLACIGGLVCLGAEAFLGRSAKHRILPWLGAIALAGAIVAQLACVHAGHLHGMLAMDGARSWLCVAILASAGLALAGLQQTLARDEYAGGEPYALTCFAAVGAMLMVMASDTIALFLGLELASLSIYALVGLRRHRHESNEALFKYFAMGAIFSALFLYGAALVYGATGTTHFGGALADPSRKPLLHLGHAFLFIGLLFKVGAVPFHFWSPDAYTGAPVVVTGFMGSVIKVGGFAALGGLWLNLVAVTSGSPPAEPLALTAGVPVSAQAMAELGRFGLAFIVLALLSIVVGNFSALRQTSARRLIAFSSVANAGYLLLALALPSGAQQLQLSGMWFYLVGYAVATSGALSAIAALSGRDDRGDDLNGLSGQGRAHPFFGLVATVCIVSIAGIPPTVGFLGKYLVFAELVAKGKTIFAVFGMLMAVVGASYYLRLVITLWSGSRSEERRVLVNPLGGLTLGAALVAVVLLMALANGVLRS